MLEIDRKNNLILKDKNIFFYLADTVWSAFTNVKMDEWEIYLKKRRTQGFNVLQINILPQGDRSENTWDNPMPFAIDEHGRDNYYEINEGYFVHCSSMLDVACKYGFTPALVLLWGDRVFDTWSNVNFRSKYMPLECVRPYVEKCVEYFSKYNPIWYISGDSDFPKEAMPWYQLALDIVREKTPHLLCSFHTGADLLSEKMVEDCNPDFYTYQSGHSRSNQYLTFEVAERYCDFKYPKPVINSEPCYEGIGSIENECLYKYTNDDVRRATWWSLFGGAKAGITYGAHGIWNWHRDKVDYCVSSLFGYPNDWSNALEMPGAWDVSYAKEIWLRYNLYELNPNKDVLKNSYRSTKCISDEDLTRIAIYIPFANKIELNINLEDYDVNAINLKERHFENIVFEKNIIFSCSNTHDYIYLLEKKDI